MTVPYCAKCGAPARSGARFCAACGAELPDTATGRTGTVIAATPPALVEAPPTASAEEQVPAADAPMLASVPPTAPLVPPSQPTPQSAIGAAAAGAPARFPNAVLGWFVVGSLVLPLVSGTEANPTPTVFAVILMLGLVVSRVRKKRFGKHWLLAAAIIGGLGFIAAIGAAGAAQDGASSVDTNSGSLLIPAVLALIARVRFGPDSPTP